MRKTEFENFTNHLYDVIFEETAKYLTDCVGESWGEELHEAHEIIMYNIVKAISKTMKINE